MQAFVAKGPNGGNGNYYVPFQQAFAPNTIPLVFLQIDKEEDNGYVSRTTCLASYNGTPSINNTGFWFQSVFLNGNVGTSGSPFTVQVLAIGTMG